MKTSLLLLLSAFTIFAQNELNLDFDYAQFRYDSTSNYLEIYYSFDQNKLTKTTENDQVIVKALMHIQIQNNETDELVVNKDWKLRQPITNGNNSSKNKSLLGVLGFVLKNGNYSVSIRVTDELNENITKGYSDNVRVIPYRDDHFSISDIELANRIINENSNTNSIFYKNTMEIFPNPSILYSNLNPVLFYYSEMYGLNTDTTNGNIEFQKKVLNSFNEVVYQKKRMIPRTQESMVEVGYVNLQKHPTDTYTLILSLSDQQSKKMVASSKKFFLHNPNVVSDNSSGMLEKNYMGSEFGILSDEECDALFTKSKIVATKNESEQYSDLDSLNAKREFLYLFWKKRDNIPATEVNEFKRAYFSRVTMAEQRYSALSNPGYRTDRGIVYIKFGEPDEIDRHPNETETKPYEVWYYNQIEGGVVFVFADLTGFNNYELLHSTKRGELQDPRWRRRIETN